MGKQRLVILSGSFPGVLCGVSGHVQLIAEGVVRRGGYEVLVLTSADRALRPETAKGYEVKGVIEDWGYLSARRICREIIKLGPNVVHIQNPTVKYTGWRSGLMSVAGPLLKKMAPSIRIVVTQHDIAIGAPAFRWRYYPLFWAAEAVIVSNRRDYQAVLEAGIDPRRLYRAPVSAHFKMHPRTKATRSAARRKFKIPRQAAVAAYFGFVHPGRNVDVLVRALSILRSRIKVYGLIIGGPFAGAEAYYDQCQSLARRLGLAGQIIWTGYATPEQVADGLAAADVFVSLLERGADLRNTSIISAILAQLPVVTTCNERYYRDPELDEMGCRYAPARDPAAAAEAVIGFLDNPPPRKLLSQRAALLDPEKIWAQHVEVNLRAYRGALPTDFNSVRPPG
ncbi:MAG: hypothetical protein AMJ79_08460 [Phycisphaerae bacterium SM23_30]|nr:MAG: hypothetical protein AMJ79_08460 [Phycisphaerae bacterium SM23_30]